jgi:hypothetical protein
MTTSIKIGTAVAGIALASSLVMGIGGPLLDTTDVFVEASLPMTGFKICDGKLTQITVAEADALSDKPDKSCTQWGMDYDYAKMTNGSVYDAGNVIIAKDKDTIQTYYKENLVSAEKTKSVATIVNDIATDASLYVTATSNQ